MLIESEGEGFEDVPAMKNLVFGSGKVPLMKLTKFKSVATCADIKLLEYVSQSKDTLILYKKKLIFVNKNKILIRMEPDFSIYYFKQFHYMIM